MNDIQRPTINSVERSVVQGKYLDPWVSYEQWLFMVEWRKKMEIKLAEFMRQSKLEYKL